MPKEYEINPWVTAGGGLVGLGLGALAYRLGNKRGAGRLAAHLLIGTGLGAGAGALTSLTRIKSNEERAKEERDKKLDKVPLSELEEIANPDKNALMDTVGGVAGTGVSRIVRERNAYTGKAISNKLPGNSIKELAAGFTSRNGRYFIRGVDVTDIVNKLYPGGNFSNPSKAADAVEAIAKEFNRQRLVGRSGIRRLFGAGEGLTSLGGPRISSLRRGLIGPLLDIGVGVGSYLATRKGRRAVQDYL